MWPWRKKNKGYYRGPRRHDDQLGAKMYSFKEWYDMKKEKEKEMRNIDFDYENEELKLKDVKLIHGETEWGSEEYSLRLVYEVDNKYARSEIIIPRLVLPINPRNLLITNGTDIDRRPEHYADIGFGNLEMRTGIGHDPKCRAVYTTKTLERYPQKMTVADIEKKLGYKIEIVSGESEG